jgi:hypothetical protein
MHAVLAFPIRLQLHLNGAWRVEALQLAVNEVVREKKILGVGSPGAAWWAAQAINRLLMLAISTLGWDGLGADGAGASIFFAAISLWAFCLCCRGGVALQHIASIIRFS